MKIFNSSIIVVYTVLVVASHAGTIIYSYDLNDRLAGVNYTQSTNQAMVSYEYDPAHNMTEHKVVTDRKFMRPFMIIISRLKSWMATPRPTFRDDRNYGGQEGT